MKNKLKVLRKKGRVQFGVESQKGQTLNIREVEDIQNGKLPFCIPFKVDVQKKSFSITYDVTNYLSLERFLQANINQAKFAEIMLTMLDAITTLQDCCYSTQNIVLELDKVMVNPSTNQILFPFVPILFYDWGISVKEFLIQCIYNTTFDSSEDTGYVNECLNILQKNLNFSTVDLRRYLEQFGAPEDAQIEGCSESVKVEMEFNPIQNMQIGKSMDKAQSIVSTPKEHTDMTSTLNHMPGKLQPCTGDKGDVSIVHVRTNRVFYLQGVEFSIGKKECDIVIDDNITVSKRHALIRKKEDTYVLCDLQSTNGTKLSGTKLIPMQEYSLCDQDIFYISNEEFMFCRK